MSVYTLTWDGATNFSPLKVRHLVAEIFDELLEDGCGDCDLDETTRFQDGREVARSYRVRGLFAMWMTTVGLIQFYDDQGNMLRTFNLLDVDSLDELEALRVAA